MTDSWRYKKPPPNRFKEALADILLLALLVGVLVFAVKTLFFTPNEETPTTQVKTEATTTTQATTTTVDVLSQAYCEGWFTGQAFALVNLGLAPEDARNAIQAGTTNPCDARNRTLDTPEEAWCLGLTDGYIDISIPYVGEPPDGWQADSIVQCVNEEWFVDSPVFGGGGAPPQDN